MVPGNACRPAPLYMAMVSSCKRVLQCNPSRQNLCARKVSRHCYTADHLMSRACSHGPPGTQQASSAPAPVSCCNSGDTGVLISSSLMSSKLVLGVTSHRDIAFSLLPQQACKSQPLSPPGFSQQLLEGGQNPLTANVRSQHARRIVHHTAHSAKAIHLPCIHQYQ